MRRFLSILLSIILAFSLLSGCGSQKNSGAAPIGDDSSSSSEDNKKGN